MIGFVHDLIVELVVTPQAGDDVPAERRAVYDPQATPLAVYPQEIDVRDVSTMPVGAEIGGSIELRHTVAVMFTVQHGDPVEAKRLRDGIAVDLALRAQAVREAFVSAEQDLDGDRRQVVDTVTWSFDWRPLAGGFSDTSESATMTFVVDATLDG